MLTHWGRVTNICVPKPGHHRSPQWPVACSAPSHHPNQCCPISNCTLGNKFLNVMQTFLCIWNAVCKMAVILSRPQCVNTVTATPTPNPQCTPTPHPLLTAPPHTPPHTPTPNKVSRNSFISLTYWCLALRGCRRNDDVSSRICLSDLMYSFLPNDVLGWMPSRDHVWIGLPQKPEWDLYTTKRSLAHISRRIVL